MDGTVYILRLERPLGNERHSAQCYVGWAQNLDARLRHHRSGNRHRGAAFTSAAVERGIDFDVVLAIPGDRTPERLIKNRKNTAEFVRRYQAGTARLPSQYMQ